MFTKHIDDNLSDLYVISLLPVDVKISIRNGRIIHEKPKGGEGFMSTVSNAMHSMKRLEEMKLFSSWASAGVSPRPSPDTATGFL